MVCGMVGQGPTSEPTRVDFSVWLGTVALAKGLNGRNKASLEGCKDLSAASRHARGSGQEAGLWRQISLWPGLGRCSVRSVL